MNKRNKNLTKLGNYFFLWLSLIFFLYYLFNNLRTNIYEVLFIDERILIDDIYNVWLVEDIYGRFENISNTFLKNILIIFIEMAYGGDLRYGRFWSNIFIIFVGPFTYISDTLVITASRILNSIMFFIGSYFLSKNIKNKEYLWISIFLIYSLPSVEYFHRIPKPDTLLAIFVGLGINYILKKKYYLSIFFLALATFIKINTVVIFVLLWIFIFFESGENKVKLFFKSILITISSLIIVNPILIIPPITIGETKLPNFFNNYINWITTQSSNGDEVIFSFQNVFLWIETLSNFYRFPNYYIFGITFSILIIYMSKKIFSSDDKLSNYFLIIFFIYIIFYFGFIERQFTHYLHLPITILLIGYFRSKDFSKLNIISFLIIFSIGIAGSFSNISKFNSDVIFTANSRYGYESINNQDDAKELVNNVIISIETIYSENSHLNTKLVNWHPDLFLPRNGVTYNSTFFVREYWGEKDFVEDAFTNSDIYVTYSNYQVGNSVEKIKIENFYIYFLKN